MIYSLTNYKITFEVPSSLKKILDDNFTIGGKGSFLESIEVKLNNDMWAVKGDYTGSYVHIMNADKTGELTISLNQMSENSKKLHNLINSYDNSKEYIPTITITNVANNEDIKITIKDAMLKKVADKKYSNEPQNDQWTFVCGEINFK